MTSTPEIGILQKNNVLDKLLDKIYVDGNCNMGTIRNVVALNKTSKSRDASCNFMRIHDYRFILGYFHTTVCDFLYLTRNLNYGF